MKFIVKTLLLVIVFCVVVIGCNDQADTSTCPDGYSLIDDDCICEGLDINGYCISRCLPDDEYYLEKGELGLFYNEAEWCKGFEGLPCPMLIRLEAYRALLSYGPIIRFGLYEEEYGLAMIPNWISTDSFERDTLLYADSGFKEKLGFMNVEQGRDPTLFTKQSGGETLYLRCYLKILHDSLLRIHFTWENSNDEIREKCTRIFHK